MKLKINHGSVKISSVDLSFFNKFFNIPYKPNKVRIEYPIYTILFSQLIRNLIEPTLYLVDVSKRKRDVRVICLVKRLYERYKNHVYITIRIDINKYIDK